MLLERHDAVAIEICALMELANYWKL